MYFLPYISLFFCYMPLSVFLVCYFSQCSEIRSLALVTENAFIELLQTSCTGTPIFAYSVVGSQTHTFIFMGMKWVF